MQDIIEIVEKGKPGDLQKVLSSVAGVDLHEKILSEALLHASLDGIVWAVKESLDNGARTDCGDNSLWTPLIRAACFGHLEVAEILLDAGAEVNAVNDYGRTALIEAASKGHNEMISLLISRGADLNVVAKVGGTALGEACWNNRPETVKFLVASGADPNVCLRDGRTVSAWAAASGHTGLLEPILNESAQKKLDKKNLGQLLLKAAEGGDLASVKFCLDRGADIHARDNILGFTALLYAARQSVELVEMLLQRGASPQSRSRGGDSAMTLAASSRKPDIVKSLLARRARVQPDEELQVSALCSAVMAGSLPVVEVLLGSQATAIDYRCGHYKGSTALMIAARQDKLELAAILLEQGADTTLTDGDGNLAAHHAALGGAPEIIELLIEHGAGLDPRNKMDATPLQLAAIEGNEATALKLIELGADINYTDRNGWTVLMKAVQGGKTALVKKLLDQGVDPAVVTGKSYSTMESYSAIRLAVEDGLQALNDRPGMKINRQQDRMAEIIDLLLEAGADPNSPIAHGTLLGSAVIVRGSEVVAALIEHGADINAQGPSGIVPLMVAVSCGNFEAVKLLVEHGADLSKVNSQGETLLDLATKYKHDKIFRYLKAMWQVKKSTGQMQRSTLREDNYIIEDDTQVISVSGEDDTQIISVGELAVLFGGCVVIILIFGQLFARFCADGHIFKSLFNAAALTICLAVLFHSKQVLPFRAAVVVALLTAALVLLYGHHAGYSRFREALFMDVLQNKEGQYDSSLLELGEDGLYEHMLQEKLGAQERVSFWNYLRFQAEEGVQERGGRKLKWNRWIRKGGWMWFGWGLQLVLFPLAAFLAMVVVYGKQPEDAAWVGGAEL
ncbi:MAG: ankyrin repeat domain-containing protein [Gemmatimonadota bacterium]|nr:ankyrin repeat domain-containing protein [Gemmatimonadota bacterium]